MPTKFSLCFIYLLLLNTVAGATISGNKAAASGSGERMRMDTACLPPQVFALSGGGSRCANDQALPLLLNGSEVGVSYQLIQNGLPLGTPVTGDGLAIAFPPQVQAGTYTVVATHPLSACTAAMQNNVEIRLFNCAITIADPCICLNNASQSDDGQLEEHIRVTAPEGQNWHVAFVDGLYDTGSPAPPLPPVPLSVGQSLTPNDTVYSLSGRHIEAQGYTVTVANGLGTQLTIANMCRYPDIAFANDLSGPFCLYSAPIVLSGNTNDVSIVAQVFSVNNVSETIFDPGQGVGAYNLEYTVNGGAPNALGPGDPGCIQSVSATVAVVNTSPLLVCNDTVQVALDESCAQLLSPDEVLEGVYACFDDYTVEIDKILPWGNGPWTGAQLSAADIGKHYGYRLQHLPSGNLCYGVVQIRDQQAPTLVCPPAVTIACSASSAPAHTGQALVSDCSSYTSVVSNIYTDFGQCANPRGQITRSWIVTDLYGNQSVCSQTITIARFDLAQVVFPPDVTVNCESALLDPNAVAPAATGSPTINGSPILGSVFCEAKVNYTDVPYIGCGNTYTILRTWSVLYDCQPLGPGNPINGTQQIQVRDLGGPQWTCPGNVTVSTDAQICCATAALPDVVLSEGCSGILGLEAQLSGVDPLTGNFFSVTVPGALSDFPGNNYWTPDTLAVFGYAQCLPRGAYQVQYTASDACGNFSGCAFTLTVEDLAPPVAACDEWTQVALAADGTASINAPSLDNGSWDACHPVYFKARRMTPNNCQTDTLFHDQVRFCCADLGDTLTVVLRVYDQMQPPGSVPPDPAIGNYNECMVQVWVEDKIKPLCQAPPSVTVSCAAFDPSLEAYGQAQAQDNCCVDTIGLQNIYTQFDSICNKGTITRRWTAYDCGGNTATCSQRVFVTYQQEFYVQFPADRVVSVCDGTGNFGTPTFYGDQDCELMSVAFADELFTVVPGACFKIERNWTVLNWCTYTPNEPCTEVPNPSPNGTPFHPSNLLGVTVSAPGTQVPGWGPTLRSLTPGGPQVDFSTFWSPASTCYRYRQLVYVLDTQDPVVVTPVSPEFCDFSQNDPALWKAPYWYDPVIDSHDLCEGDANLEITATDACTGGNIRFKYLLFLDLDGNGAQETVVNSHYPFGYPYPVYNNVQFGNISAPNYMGGESRQFDFRPVPPNQKWGWGVQQDPPSGNQRSARVRWVNALGQNAIPQLPYGQHTLRWIIEDGCGNETVSEQHFTVRDCKKPTVVCLNGLAVPLMNVPAGTLTLWAADFLDYTEDNCTPPQGLRIAVRRSGEPDGQGNTTGFPRNADGTAQQHVSFTCADLGTQLVELWSIDQAGNADFCTTYLLVQDNTGICTSNPATANVAGNLLTAPGEGVEDVAVELAGDYNGIPLLNFSVSDNAGLYQFSNALPYAANAQIVPSYDIDPLNGVNTWDLILISRHILGITPFDSPYKLIAADANKSGTVTTFDIVELRKLILGSYSSLPNNKSWRFIDQSQVFSDNNNPFLDVIREEISLDNVVSDITDADFVSVKTGDVDNTAQPNNLFSNEARAWQPLYMDVADAFLKAGETAVLTLNPDRGIAGWQGTLVFEGMAVEAAGDGIHWREEHFGWFGETDRTLVTVCWDAPAGEQTGCTFRVRALRDGRISELLSLSDRITPAIAFTERERLQPTLRFDRRHTLEANFEGYAAFPNPWRDHTAIRFYQPEDGAARITVWDAGGRLVYSDRGHFSKGTHTFTLRGREVPATGVFRYQVTTATGSGMGVMVRY